MAHSWVKVFIGTLLQNSNKCWNKFHVTIERKTILRIWKSCLKKHGLSYHLSYQIRSYHIMNHFIYHIISSCLPLSLSESLHCRLWTAASFDCCLLVVCAGSNMKQPRNDFISNHWHHEAASVASEENPGKYVKFPPPGEACRDTLCTEFQHLTTSWWELFRTKVNKSGDERCWLMINDMKGCESQLRCQQKVCWLLWNVQTNVREPNCCCGLSADASVASYKHWHMEICLAVWSYFHHSVALRLVSELWPEKQAGEKPNPDRKFLF